MASSSRLLLDPNDLEDSALTETQKVHLQTGECVAECMERTQGDNRAHRSNDH